MLIPRFREEKEPVYDHRAGQQIFDRVKNRENTRPTTIVVPKDTENPIDIRLRQLALMNCPFDLCKEFIGKWAAVFVQTGLQLTIYTGRIKDIFPSTRDIWVRTRAGKDVIVPIGNVIEYSERELS